MGSRPPWTNRGLAAGTGPSDPAGRPRALTSQTPHLPALALPPREGVVLLVLMTTWKSKPQRNFSARAKPLKVKTRSASVFCETLSMPGCCSTSAFLRFLRRTEQKRPVRKLLGPGEWCRGVGRDGGGGARARWGARPCPKRRSDHSSPSCCSPAAQQARSCWSPGWREAAAPCFPLLSLNSIKKKRVARATEFSRF